MESRKKLFHIISRCYDLSGLRKRSKFVYKLISCYVLYPLLLGLLFLVVFNFRYKHNDITDIAEVFVSFVTFGHLFIRKTLFLLKKQLIEKLLHDLEGFWNYDSCGKTFGDGLRKTMSLCTTSIAVLLMGGCANILIYTVVPFFLDEISLPHACWNPTDKFIVLVILYCLEVLFYYEILFLLLIFDALYVAMCTELKIQFKLLGATIATIRIGEEPTAIHERACLEKLKVCCRYHQFLLSVHKNLNKLFSEFYLGVFFLTVTGNCLPLFTIIDSNSTFVEKVLGADHMLMTNTLCAILFLPAGEIEIEAENLSHEVYGIDWYNSRSSRIDKFVLFWLGQTQIPLQMSGAGIIKVNRAVMLQIPRIGFSITTVLTRIR